jgi:hypothetical protein
VTRPCEHVATGHAFKVWRVPEEKEVADEQGHKYRVITKKEFVGEIVNPKQEIYVTWMELVERFGEGYYLVEIPKEIRQRYALPAEQRVTTPCAHAECGRMELENSVINIGLTHPEEC